MQPRVLLGGLAMPESPRWHDSRLWFSTGGRGRSSPLTSTATATSLESVPDGLGWEGDREVLNELAAQPCLVPRLLPGPTRTRVGAQGGRSLMSSVARERDRRLRRAACCTTQAVRGIAVLAGLRRHVAVRSPALVLDGALR
jgi:hypothetical protein